ncbi:MAG TPA: ABC transporter permease [Gemmatimonadaceae bacterium]|nr:ABC transporter permease [Gemmatimonadaceae bacterium]
MTTARWTAGRPRLGVRLRELWARRELVRALTVRNLKVKYQRSALGFLWTVLNPLLVAAVLVVVFGHVVRVPVPQYWAFVLSGYFVWNFVQQSLAMSTYVIAEHAGMRRSVRFPAEAPIVAAIASRVVEFAGELALVALALAVWRHGGVPASYALLPLLVAAQVLLVLGLVLPLSAIAVFYRDVQHALPVALAVLFYISPVFYPAALVPGALHAVYLWNPVASILTIYHIVLFDGALPSGALLAGVLAGSTLAAMAGYVVFSRSEARFAEIV